MRFFNWLKWPSARKEITSGQKGVTDNQPGVALAVIRTPFVVTPNINETDDEGCTPLVRAIDADDLVQVRTLLEQGADPNQPFTGNGEVVPPLITVFLKDTKTPADTEIVKVLLAHQADPNAKDSSFGGTALHWAANKQRPDIAFVLLAYDRTDLVAKDNKGAIPLRKAEQVGITEASEIIRLAIRQAMIEKDIKGVDLGIGIPYHPMYNGFAAGINPLDPDGWSPEERAALGVFKL